jgi:RimJ/RimL family protein N-acetyltransferase
LHAEFQPREIALRDGRSVQVRAILPSDEEEILQAFDRMGMDARYMRFMTSVRHANVPRLRNVLASLPQKGLAIAATVPAPDGIDIVGTASFVMDGAGGCEFAISILEAWGGAGLGRGLMEALIGAAKDRGLAEMKGFVLAQNRAMLRLAERVGFKVKADPEDFSVRIVTLAL